MATTVQGPSKKAYAENREFFDTDRGKVFKRVVDHEEMRIRVPLAQ